VVALTLAGLALLLAAAAALAVTGDLTQPAGNAGCVSEDGSGPCADGRALDAPLDVAVSPDGKSVYAPSYFTGAVAHLNRNPTTGAISQPAGTTGCISDPPFGSEPCADGHAIDYPTAVAVSADGKSVYATSSGGGFEFDGGVVHLNRNATTGALTQPTGTDGCVSDDGSGPCANGHALLFPVGVAVSPDGKSVYVASFGGDALARFNRNPATGALSQPTGTAGCVSQTGSGPCANGRALDGAQSVAISADGKRVYVASSESDAVARLNRDTTTGALTQIAGRTGCISATGSENCTDGHGLNGAFGVAISPDGKNVYVASEAINAVARLDRNLTTGTLSQPAGRAGCVSESGAGICANGRALHNATDVAVSPDGKSVYVASSGSGALARFNRNPATGALSQPAGITGCTSEDGSGPCANGHALDFATDVTVSADGKSVYVASLAVARFNRAP
jgi:DNA-binding beta-propeller fold protein YncE